MLFFCASGSLFAQSTDQYTLAPNEVYWKNGPVKERIETIEPASSPNVVLAQSKSLNKSKGEQPRLVFYEKDKPRNDFTRRILSESIVVTLREGANADAIAAALGATNAGRIALPGNRYRFRLLDYNDVLGIEDRVDDFIEIIAIERQFARLQERRSVPNDPLFPEQWHLVDDNPEVYDINLGDVWETYTGAGVVIGIVDDGLAINHPDLLPNMEPSMHYDFRDGDTDPSPELLTPDTDDGSSSGEDKHGTAVAGLAAARGNNGIGVSGVAPQAHLAGLRLIGDYAEDVTEAEAFLHGLQSIDIKNNSWGPAGFGDVLIGPGPLAKEALKQAAEEGRGGKGTIFVWAAGNGRFRKDDCNKDGYSSSPYTISVGAVSEFGKQAIYSESGASLMICAPSLDSGARGLVTTDLLANDGYNHDALKEELDDLDYTLNFSGTSGSAPIISGIVALLLEANPNLNWRDVQEILIRSARQVDADDQGWFDNAAAAPFHFNRKYGAGLVDVEAAISLAESWTSLGVRKSLSAQNHTLSLPANVPDDATTLEVNFAMPSVGFRVEHAEMRLSLTHESRGELEIILISPNGTESMLLASTDLDQEADIVDFAFNSVHFWGESAGGEWTLRIVDKQTELPGELTQATLTLYGTATSNALPATPRNLVFTRLSTLSAWMAWEDIADNETGYRIERAAGYNKPWTLVATTKPGVTYYYDETLDGEFYYFYRVTAISGDIQSAYTEPAESYRAFLETTQLYYANFEADQGFETGALAGQNGWGGANTASNKVLVDTSMGGMRLASLGGNGYQGSQYDYVYGSAVYFADARSEAHFSCQLEIDSTLVKAKDRFGVGFYNLSGQLLFVLEFDAKGRDLYYYNSDYVYHSLNRSFSLRKAYDLEIIINLTSNTWSASLDGRSIGSNLPVAKNTNDLSGIAYHEFSWYVVNTSLPGANRMLFDDVKLEMVASSVPDAPLALEGFAQGSSVVFLYWNDPFLARTYHIEGRKVGDAEWVEMLNFPVEDWPLPVAVKGLEPDTEYEFRVQAENNFGFSYYSDIVAITSLREYQDWLRQYDLEVDVPLLADPYEVGHPLLLAYALGIHPERFSERRLPKQSIDEGGGMITLRYYRSRDDVVYKVMMCDNLVGPWTTSDVIQDYEVDGRFITAAAPIPASGATFLQLVTTLADQ
ncbi:S8 family serine peptidase [Cerasicoccus arenae]|uniref:S8 family serine peptidase n=1 Tax=Cerasicoccus arenae TaxID=424488 RepID=UPI00190667D8|nr:S8 family serine peptidase [Cerasicoccus arenae]MBK1858362.1 S8 family serine peptidase [Cerasicoccus arenae]